MNTIKLVFAFFVFFSNHVFAQQGLVNVNLNNQVAIHGYDTVAYFTNSEPTQGDESYQYEHHGAIWYFSNQQHLDMFKDDPEKYMPQYGGHCAYAASQGAKADIDPIAWRIIDGKLYLNYDLRVQKVWAGSLEEHIKAGDGFWANQ